MMELTYDECKAALRMRLNAMSEMPIHWQNPCTPKQYQAVVITFQDALEDSSREIRLAVIKEILDIPIQSTKDLLKWEATCLIDFLKEDSEFGNDEWRLSNHGRNFIAEAERKVANRFERTASQAKTHQFSFV
jgi:hypothetical protein